MAWNHHTPYRFYIQLYPQNGVKQPVWDVEESFACRYVKMTNNAPTDVKNTYSEDFPEADGSRIWLPPQLTYKSSEITLYLRWRSEECGNVLLAERIFREAITGQKLEWHDTFRPNRYWQLVLEKAPEFQTEILNRDKQYIIVAYKFTNFGGKCYDKSQL